MYRNAEGEYWEREFVWKFWIRTGIGVIVCADKCILCVRMNILMKNHPGMVE
jgi:hypothetical protein